jgi:hypothetical protein
MMHYDYKRLTVDTARPRTALGYDRLHRAIGGRPVDTKVGRRDVDFRGVIKPPSIRSYLNYGIRSRRCVFEGRPARKGPAGV